MGNTKILIPVAVLVTVMLSSCGVGKQHESAQKVPATQVPNSIVTTGANTESWAILESNNSGSWKIQGTNRHHAEYGFLDKDGVARTWSYLTYISQENAVSECIKEVTESEWPFRCQEKNDSSSIISFFDLLKKHPDISKFPEDATGLWKLLHVGGMMEIEKIVKKYKSGYLTLWTSAQYAWTDNITFHYYWLNGRQDAILHYSLQAGSLPNFIDIFRWTDTDALDEYYSLIQKEFVNWQFSNTKLQKVFEDFVKNVDSLEKLAWDIGIQP